MIRLLVVDDDFAYTRLIAAALEDVADVLAVHALREALDVPADDIDVVLCDLGLPDGEGEAVVSALAAALPAVTIVATSGHDAGWGERALRAGAARFLLKGGELDGSLRAAVLDAANRTAGRRAAVSAEAPPSGRDTVAEHAAIALLAIDGHGSCSWANARFGMLAGIPSDRALGDGWVDALHPADRPAVLEAWHRGTATGREFSIDARVARGSAVILDVRLVVAPASPGQWTVAVTDETARRAADRSHAHRLAQLQSIIDASPSAILMKDPSGRFVLANPACEAIIDRPRDEIVGADAAALPGPEHPERVGGLDRVVLETGTARHDEFVASAPDGAEHTWLAQRFPVRDADGVLTGIGVIASDVTEARRLETALRSAESQLRLIFDHAPIGLGLADLDGHLLRVNPAACSLLGRRAAELLGTPLAAVVHPDDRDADAESLARLLAGELDSYEIEKRCLRPDGSRLWVVFAMSTVRGIDGRPEQLVVQLLDMTVRRDLEARLTEMTDVDPATGLPNVRRLRDEIDRAITWRRRSGEPATLLLLEPTTPIHPDSRSERELALRELGGLLRRSTRRSDIVVRADGDRFALLLPGTTVVAARIVVGKLEAAIAEAGLIGRAHVSVTELASGTTTVDDVLQRADGALAALRDGT